jgi:hypothetical protein
MEPSRVTLPLTPSRPILPTSGSPKIVDTHQPQAVPASSQVLSHRLFGRDFRPLPQVALAKTGHQILEVGCRLIYGFTLRQDGFLPRFGSVA